MSCAEPADEWHDGLEQAKEECHAENAETQGTAHNDATHDAHRKTVHSQGHGEEQNVYDTDRHDSLSFCRLGCKSTKKKGNRQIILVFRSLIRIFAP